MSFATFGPFGGTCAPAVEIPFVTSGAGGMPGSRSLSGLVLLFPVLCCDVLLGRAVFDVFGFGGGGTTGERRGEKECGDDSVAGLHRLSRFIGWVSVAEDGDDVLVVLEGAIADDDAVASVLENSFNGVVVDIGVVGVAGGVELVVTVDAGGELVVAFEDESRDASLMGSGPDLVDAPGIAVARPGRGRVVAWRVFHRCGASR